MKVKVISDPGITKPRVGLSINGGVVDIDNPVLYVPVEIAKCKTALANIYLKAKKEIKRRELE